MTFCSINKLNYKFLNFINEITRRNMSSGRIIREVLSEIEDESIAKLSPLEYLEQHLEAI